MKLEPMDVVVQPARGVAGRKVIGVITSIQQSYATVYAMVCWVGEVHNNGELTEWTYFPTCSELLDTLAKAPEAYTDAVLEALTIDKFTKSQC